MNKTKSGNATPVNTPKMLVAMVGPIGGTTYWRVVGNRCISITDQIERTAVISDNVMEARAQIRSKLIDHFRQLKRPTAPITRTAAIAGRSQVRKKISESFLR